MAGLICEYNHQAASAMRPAIVPFPSQLQFQRKSETAEHKMISFTGNTTGSGLAVDHARARTNETRDYLLRICVDGSLSVLLAVCSERHSDRLMRRS